MFKETYCNTFCILVSCQYSQLVVGISIWWNQQNRLVVVLVSSGPILELITAEIRNYNTEEIANGAKEQVLSFCCLHGVPCIEQGLPRKSNNDAYCTSCCGHFVGPRCLAFPTVACFDIFDTRIGRMRLPRPKIWEKQDKFCGGDSSQLGRI